MATISQILSALWPGQVYELGDENTYSTLNWRSDNSLPRPTESEIRSHSEQVDLLLIENGRAARQQQAMQDSPDYLLRAFEIIVQGFVEYYRVINDLRSTIKTAAHTGDFTQWDTQVINRLQALKQKLLELRGQP